MCITLNISRSSYYEKSTRKISKTEIRREEIKKEVSIIEKRSKLFTYGMATESVKSYFKNPAVCNTKEEFMGAVIGDLSRYIRRG